MERKARCSCGQLRITVKGDPQVVVVCHCTRCQIRTGSVFGVSSYFGDDTVVSIEGNSKTLERTNDAGRKSKRDFCPDCGTTVFWKTYSFPESTGIAVGCFADPTFPAPKASVWNSSKHDWVNLPEDMPCSDTQEFG